MSASSNDVIGWLLEDNNPSVKYWTLRNLLNYDQEDYLVSSTRRRIMEIGAVPDILSRLNAEGHYASPAAIQEYGEKRAAFGYLPKYRGTVWQLLLFAELGADPTDEHVRRTCEYVLKHSWEPSGLFTMMGTSYLAPCFQGNMLYALTRLGYGDDRRVMQGFEVLVQFTRFDDGGFVTPKTFPYRPSRDRCSGSHSCYAGCLKALKAISVLPREKWDGRIYNFVARGAEFFLTHQVFRSSHSAEKMLRKDIDRVTFPTFVYGDFLEILTTLLELGIKDVRMQEAISLLRSKQLPNGRWRLERDVQNMHVPLARKNYESQWATYRALYALKLWEERGTNMLDLINKYRQIVTLADGTRALLRPLTTEDKDGLIALFEPLSTEDLKLMHSNVRDRELVASWVDQLDYKKVLPLVAVVNGRIVGDATLRFHVGPERHIGDVRIFIAKEFRRRGLGSALLRGLIDLARKCGLRQLVAEMLANQAKTISAFEQLGFEVRATFPDHFMNPDGETHDIKVLILNLVPKREEF